MDDSLDATVQQTVTLRDFSSYDNFEICVVQFPVIFEIKGGEDEGVGVCGDGSGDGSVDDITVTSP